MELGNWGIGGGGGAQVDLYAKQEVCLKGSQSNKKLT